MKLLPARNRNNNTLDDDVTSQWKDQFYHQSKFSDGEIYRKVAFFMDKKIQSEVDVWMVRTSPCKRVAIKQLLKRDDFKAAFNALLQFPGLWGGFELGNIQRLLALCCDEVG